MWLCGGYPGKRVTLRGFSGRERNGEIQRNDEHTLEMRAVSRGTADQQRRLRHGRASQPVHRADAAHGAGPLLARGAGGGAGGWERKDDRGGKSSLTFDVKRATLRR